MTAYKILSPQFKIWEYIYKWIGAFYESPLHFYLKIDPINRVYPNEVVGERDVVLFMEETTLEAYTEFLSFCDTMEKSDKSHE